MIRRSLTLAALCLCAGRVSAQSSAPDTTTRPMVRMSLFTNNAQSVTPADGTSTSFGDLTSALSVQLPDVDTDGLDYGLDLRHAVYTGAERPARFSLYEGFVGARFGNGLARVRAGHLWLNDLGSLGSVAGGLFEGRTRRASPEGSRFRAGVFGGLEPNIFEAGYADNVKKAGAYVAYDGQSAQRDTFGYVLIRNASLTERSVLTTNNFVPIGKKLFVYQAAEYDVAPPAGQAKGGLAYLFATARAVPTERLELQGTYNRGRSIDARGLSEDILAGRPLTQQAVDGFLYESIGGRATVEVAPRLRVYGGYSRDKNNVDADPTNRFQAGGYAPNFAETGFDLTVSDSLMDQPTGSYHSFYASIGRSVKRSAYVSADYSTSLSVVRFSDSTGVTVETRPKAQRFSATGTVNFARNTSLLVTVERVLGDQSNEWRLMSGITYRFR